MGDLTNTLWWVTSLTFWRVLNMIDLSAPQLSNWRSPLTVHIYTGRQIDQRREKEGEGLDGRKEVDYR